MFVIQISLLIVTFLFLISRILVMNANHQRIQPTLSPCAMCQHVECHLFFLFSFFFLCHLLNVGAFICHITWEGQVEWTTPHYTIKMLHFVLFHNVTCYTISIVSRIHINITKLRNITCTLVAKCMILWSLECACCDPSFSLC